MVGPEKNIISTSPLTPHLPHKHFQEGKFRQVISQYGEFGKKQRT